MNDSHQEYIIKKGAKRDLEMRKRVKKGDEERRGLKR